MCEQASRVTRFGEILPFCQTFTSLCANFWQFNSYLAKYWGYFGKFVTVEFLLGKYTEPTFANLSHYWANIPVANGQILKNNLTIWSHCKRAIFFVLAFLPATHSIYSSKKMLMKCCSAAPSYIFLSRDQQSQWIPAILFRTVFIPGKGGSRRPQID